MSLASDLNQRTMSQNQKQRAEETPLQRTSTIPKFSSTLNCCFKTAAAQLSMQNTHFLWKTSSNSSIFIAARLNVLGAGLLFRGKLTQ